MIVEFVVAAGKKGQDRGWSRIDDGLVTDVLLLRGHRHGQVLLDQPSDKVRVVTRQAVLAAEAAGVARAEH